MPHNEDDWNDISTIDTTPYALSKTLAERAAWQFVETHQPSFVLSTINPCLVFGPVLSNDSSVINTSSEALLSYVNGTQKTIRNRSMHVVDVRDVAAAHVAAMECRDESVYGRFLCAGDGVYPDKELVEYAREVFPEIEWPSQVNPEPEQFSTAVASLLSSTPRLSSSLTQWMRLNSHRVM